MNDSAYKPSILSHYSGLGLSCVENHMLAILSASGWKISDLLSGSLVSVPELYDYFLIDEKPYAFFSGAVKSHEWLKSIGAVSISKCPVEGCFMDDTKHTQHLLQISKETVEYLFKKKPFRDDHYVLMCKDEANIYLMNDLPARCVSVSKEFIKQNAVSALEIKMIKRPEDSDYARMDSALYSKALEIVKTGCVGLDVKNALLNEKTTVQVRDMLGMLKLLLERLNLFVGEKGGTTLSKYIHQISRLHMQVNYQILRKNAIDEEIPIIMSTINHAVLGAAQMIISLLH